MTIFLITALLLIAGFILWKTHSRVGIFLLLITLILIELIGSGTAPALLLDYLQRDFPSPLKPHWQPTNVIILLAAGMHQWPDGTLSSGIAAQSRLQETLRLYHQCKQEKRVCTILISGGALKNARTEASVYRQSILDLGIHPSDVLTEQNSKNTFENAAQAQKILARHHFDYRVLVSSGFHLQRANLFFRYFNLHCDLAPSDYMQPYFSILPLSYNFFLMDIAIHEYFGMAYFYYLHHFFKNT